MTKEELIYYAQSRDFFIYDQNAFKQIAREEGFKEGLVTVARTMIAQGVSAQDVSPWTGLSIEGIEAIAKEEDSKETQR